MQLVDSIMAYEDGKLSAKSTIKMFADLIKSGMVWNLQGCYGRMASKLIDAGYVDKQGNILKNVEGARNGKYRL